jgi:hypothetical protein
MQAKLLKEYSSDQDIERMVQGVAMSHADQYAPRISQFCAAAPQMG